MSFRDLVISETPFEMPVLRECVFPVRDFPITDYGAKPEVKCTDAFVRAMESCERAGGGTVSVPAGKWLTGAVHFRNNCNLRLEQDAVLEFTDDPADYPEVHTTWEGIECYNHSPLLFAYGVTNVAITGSGTIAPRMDFWRTWFSRSPEHMKATELLYYWCSTNAPMASRRLLKLDRAHMRPHLIQFNRCGNVLLDGFKIRESPFWMIHLYHSENCIVRNLDTYAHGHNNDGVDVDMTKNVLIEKCHFDQGDDGIVLKAGRNADAWRLDRCTENVVVRDCDMVACHSLLGIGSELSGGVRNVWMTRCTVKNTWSMLRIKTGPPRGGFVENIWFDHCRGDRTVRVFDLITNYRAQWGAFPDFELRRTRIRNINVSDCMAEVAAEGIELLGDRLCPAREIRIRNVKIDRVVRSLSTVRDCKDVVLTGLTLGAPATSLPRARLFVSGDLSLDDSGLSQSGLVRFPYQSWGVALQSLMVEGCSVQNHTADGATAKGFQTSNRWKQLISEVRPGDFVVIAFGHDCQKRAVASSCTNHGADPKGSLREIIGDRVAQVRYCGATPVLVSTICCGMFESDGWLLVDSERRADCSCRCCCRDAMRDLAAELDCDFVDMNGLACARIERGGKGTSIKMNVEAFAQLFVKDVKGRNLPVVELFR